MVANTETERQITVALARQLGSMELATQVVATGIRAMGGIHQDAAEEVATALATVDSMVKAAAYAGRMTSQKKQTLAWLTEAYLDDILYHTNDAAAQIIDVLLDGL